MKIVICLVSVVSGVFKHRCLEIPGPTRRFSSSKLHADITIDVDITAVSIQPIARRTTTASILLIVNEVLGREVLRINPVITALVFSKPNFIPIVVRKRRIALAMTAVGNVGVDAVLLGVGY